MSFADLLTPPLSPGLKQTALLVHSLHKADRAWLLQQLSPQQRENVLTLLNELEVLGIPSDPGLLNDALSPVDARSVPIAPAAALNSAEGPKKSVQADAARLNKTPDEELTAHLDLADASILADILRQEPAGLIARILLIKNWPWHDAILEKLNPNLRNQVKSLLRGPTDAKISPLLAKNLLLHFFQRYEESWSSKQLRDHKPGVAHQVSPTVRRGPLYAWTTRIKRVLK